MPIVNLGSARSQAEAMRAIRFLSRKAGLPIGFFGITNRVYVREVPNEPEFCPSSPSTTTPCTTSTRGARRTRSAWRT